MADLFEPEDQEGFQKVHLGLCTLILVLNSQKRKINVEALRQLGIETLLEVSKTFPWAIVSQTVHRICAHGWEKVAWNGDLGLGSNSEEGLESLNKFIRQIRSRRSRTNSTENNFRDTFNHLWRKSSPKIVALEREKGCRKKPLLVQQELEAFIEKYFLEDIWWKCVGREDLFVQDVNGQYFSVLSRMTSTLSSNRVKPSSSLVKLSYLHHRTFIRIADEVLFHFSLYEFMLVDLNK